MSSPAARALAAILSNFGASAQERDAERRAASREELKAKRALDQLMASRQPKKTYDSKRGAMVDEDTSVATPVSGLPAEPTPKAKTIGHQISQDGTPYDIWQQPDGSVIWKKATIDGAAAVSSASTNPPTVTAPPKFGTREPKPDLAPTEVPDGKGGTKTVWGPKVAGAEIPEKDKPTPALMIAAMNRLGLAEGDINDAIASMEKDENDPEFRKEMTAATQALATLAQTQPNPEAHGLSGALSNAAGSLLSGKAQEYMRDHPRIATYMRNKRTVGTAATEILPRPSQQLLAIEQGLSGMDVGWNPDMIADVQRRRRRMGEMLHQSLQSTPLGGKTVGTKKLGAQSDTRTEDQKLWDAAVALHGREKVLREYGPRP